MRPFRFEVYVGQMSQLFGGTNAGKWTWSIIVDDTMVRFANEDDVLHHSEASARAEAGEAVRELVKAMQAWLLCQRGT